MRCFSYIVALAAAFAAAGCATRSGAEHPSDLQSAIASAEALGLRVLTRAEVERLIVGHAVVVDYGRTSSFPPPLRETFLANGEYRVFGHRNAAAQGTYRFQRDSVCIAIASSETCLIFLVDPEGNHFKKGVGQNYGPPEPIAIDHNP